MAPSDDWRPYTIPYSGEGALKRSDGQWVPSSQVLVTPYSHHSVGGDNRPDALMDIAPPCGPPASAEDTSATADSDHDKPAPDVPLSSHEINPMQQLQEQHMSSFHAAPVQHARFVGGASISSFGDPSYSGDPTSTSGPGEPTLRRARWGEDEEQSGGDGGAVSK